MKFFLGILLVASATTGFVQHRQIQAVRTALAPREELLAEAARLQTEDIVAQNPPLNDEQIVAMRADRAELMRLRASLSELRAAARSPEAVALEIAKLKEGAAGAERTAAALLTTYEAEKQNKVERVALLYLSILIQEAQKRTGGSIVRSLEDLERALGLSPADRTLAQYEFVPESASRSGTILLRERQPRRLPSGRWTRAYLLANQKIETPILPDGDFSAWERED